MSKYYNIGDTVGYWTLIEEVPKPEGRVYNGIYWNCKCKCGTELWLKADEQDLWYRY